MSEPPTAHASLSASGYADGLGWRTLEFDREAGSMLERLHLRAEFRAFDGALRYRMECLASFDDARFGRARSIERDASGALSILSTYVAGDRLSDLLEAATNLPAHEATSPSVDAALGFLLEVLPALDALHSATGLSHGALGPGRITLTPTGQVVMLDTLFGQALERLQFNRRRFWTEFGLAIPAAAGPSRFDRAADISQASLAAMMIVLGRPFRDNDYPDALPDLITEVIEIAQIRGSGRFASDLHKFLHRTLPLPARRAHGSAEEAAVEVRQVAHEIGVQRCRAALTAFVGDMNRVMCDARGLHSVEQGTVNENPVPPTEITLAEPVFAQSDTEPPHIDETVESAPEFVEQPAFDETTPAPIVEPAQQSVEDTVPEWARLAEPPPVVEAPRPPAIAAIVEPPVPPVALAPPPAPIAEPAPTPVEPTRAPAAIAPLPMEAAPNEPPPEPTAAESKRARRNARRHRDRLRSHAIPPPAPAPAPPAPVRQPLIPPTPAFAAVMPLPSVPAPAPPPRKTAQPLREEAPILDQVHPIAPLAPIRVDPPAAAPLPISPVAFRSDPVPPRMEPVAFKPNPTPFKSEPLAFKPEPLGFKSEPLAFKNESRSGFSTGAIRPERRVAHAFSGPYFEREAPEQKRRFPWRLVAAALLVIGVGIGAGRKYLPAGNQAAEAAPAPSKEVVAAAKIAAAAEQSGTVVLSTEPAGAHVLLDGKEMGDSPLTLENVPAGKHALTFVTASASVKRIIRVEAGKTAALDVAVFSGWIAVFSPIPLDIEENGRAIGSSEQGRLMLSPGRHQLKLTNAELGYSSVRTVDIEPGEEHPVSVQPTGELSANAVPWAEVWMNGKKIGETPIAGIVVPLGTHEVIFKNPQFPERRVSVTVTASTPVTTSVDFSK